MVRFAWGLLRAPPFSVAGEWPRRRFPYLFLSGKLGRPRASETLGPRGVGCPRISRKVRAPGRRIPLPVQGRSEYAAAVPLPDLLTLGLSLLLQNPSSGRMALPGLLRGVLDFPLRGDRDGFLRPLRSRSHCHSSSLALAGQERDARYCALRSSCTLHLVYLQDFS